MKPIKIGTKTKFGKIAGVLWVGERYYFIIGKDGTVSLMPESAIK